MQVWINQLSMQHVSIHHNSKHLTVFSSIRTCSSTPSSRKSSRTSLMTSSITDLYSLGYNESKQIESLLTTELQNITIQYSKWILYKWMVESVQNINTYDLFTNWTEKLTDVMNKASLAMWFMMSQETNDWDDLDWTENLTSEEESYFNGLVSETLKNKRH